MMPAPPGLRPAASGPGSNGSVLAGPAADPDRARTPGPQDEPPRDASDPGRGESEPGRRALDGRSDRDGPGGRRGPEPRRRGRHVAGRPIPPARLPAWPLAILLIGYPIWWALGLGVLIFPMLAIPMAALLLRVQSLGRPLRLPPGFALWVLFLTAIVISMAALGAEPPGTVPEHASDRLLGAGFRIGEYAALTVLLLYAGNLREDELPRRRLVRLLGWLFVVTVAGGMLGVLAGNFAFTSPVELLLAPEVRSKGFIQSLVHPYAAQIMNLPGNSGPRPAAPWGYTNTWGNNFCLLVVWFVVAVWGTRTRPGARLLALACLAVSVVPVVQSLNRGLWIGLGFAVLYVVARLVLAGRVWVIAGVLIAGAALAATLAATPLGEVVSTRLDNGKSNGVRMYLTQHALAGLAESPAIGFGSTRNTLGGRNSIAVGESANCERCGNFTIGGNGQLWQLLFAHGLVGTAAYLGFFGYGLWRFRRDRSPIGVAGGAAVAGTFLAMFWYNALVTPLAFAFLAYALLWRNEMTRDMG